MNGQELAKIDERQVMLTPLSTDAVLTRVAQVKDIMDDVMKPDVHYGTIPGCDKPSLYQAGAEKLALTFRLAIAFPRDDMVIERTMDRFSATVLCVITDQGSGNFLGSEWGTCSSDEEKYAWRKGYDDEFDAAPVEKKRTKTYKKSSGSSWMVKQLRTNPADVANTVLAMACKRAKVRAVRAVLGVSDMFEVNIEDLPEELREEYFGDQDTPEQKAAPKQQREKAKKTEQRAHAGVSGQETAEVEKVSQEQTRAYMQAMKDCGFTFQKEDGKTGFTQEGKDFLASIGAASFFKEMPMVRGAEVITALQAEFRRREEAAKATAAAALADTGEETPEITDPFADQ